MLEFLQGKKTYILMALSIIGALLSFATGQFTIMECITAIMFATGIGSLRADVIPGIGFLAKYRSYLLMAGGVVSSIISYLTGDFSAIELVISILGAFGIGSFSAGIKKDAT